LTTRAAETKANISQREREREREREKLQAEQEITTSKLHKVEPEKRRNFQM
jgi:hypothetical protein